MNMISKSYTKIMSWSKHRYAPLYLVGLSFAESCFLPAPPDLLLAPMSLARPKRAWFYAILTTTASVVGGLVGYTLGLFCFDFIHPYILSFGYGHEFQLIESWFHNWGIWVMVIAGLAPMPYKLFTLVAGAMSMSIVPFIIAVTFGRGMRFFLIAAAALWGSARLKKLILKKSLLTKKHEQ